jgi:LmbE family N-acetylglucosaminyl deacetylase
MLGLSFGTESVGLREVLLLGAHCDDIEIGCGGTVLELIRRYPDLRIHWVVFSSEEGRGREAEAAAEDFLAGAGYRDIRIASFRNAFFPYVGAEIKDYFERLKAEISPDLILTHHRDDLHQDHRVLAEFTWNTFRNHMIAEYEIPKYDGGLTSPNVFVPVSADSARRKVEILMDRFGSQRSKRWFTPDTFHALLRLRGVESNAPSGYAEGFHCRKAVLDLAPAPVGDKAARRRRTPEPVG